MANNFKRIFGPLNSPVPLSYLDDCFQQLQDASTSTVSLSGAALIGFAPSGTGATTTDVQTELRGRAINAVTQFGLSTSGTASANRTALANAIVQGNSTSKAVYIPAGTYSIDPSGGTINTSTLIFGDGRNQTILSIAGNGNLLARSSYSVLQDLQIDMQGATYSGDACTFAGTSGYQTDRSVSIKNLRAGKYALNFSADGGGQFNSFGCLYHTLASQGVDAAVKVTGTDTAAAVRTFHGTNGDGCTVWDIGGGNDFFIFGGYTNCILWSSSAAVNTFVHGLRIGAAGGAVTVKGAGHQIIGCDFASSSVTLDASTSGVVFNSSVPNYAITDSGTSNLVYIGAKNYTVSWTGSVSNPAIGNGSLTGLYTRTGRFVTAQVDLEIGTTTTMGSGTWFFSLPLLEAGNAIVSTGCGYVQSAGTVYPAVPIDLAGSQKVQVMANGGNITNAAPGAWAAGDFVRFTIVYQVP